MDVSPVQGRVTLGTQYFCDKEKEHGVVEHFKNEEGPFMVGDVADIVYKFHLWKREMPEIMPYFAVKANPHPTVLRILAELGAAFDCASKDEMEAVMSLGVSPSSHMIYANTCKSPANLTFAFDSIVRLMTFDNEYELKKMWRFQPAAVLLIRIRADESGVALSFGTKFGCELDEVPYLLREATRLMFPVVGVSFHIGFNNSNPTVYATTIGWCKKVFQMAEVQGIRMKVVDIGGGFPGANEPQFLEISRIVRDALEEHFNLDDIAVMAEPGTFFVESAFTLYTQVIGKRQKGNQKMYFLNDGAYGSFRQCAVYQSLYEPEPVIGGRSLEPGCSVWGPTCASDDRIIQCCPLPDMDIGEWVAFRNMGAYEGEVATNFNGFPKPTVVFAVNAAIRPRFEACRTWPELLKLLKEQIAHKLDKK
ncbi:hypothetical protein JTE90_025212 [Oedothorax gibbosus]|uniref:ornithine decarboxylase n=1 Tax=Oedothorax gibbosus TaxID=931172 RepID=A0AAV6UU56_9ARAC|nr:hypothetical protein JTE90_025212 [Oedothorax gibbosus]